jgi:hypothetical protein
MPCNARVKFATNDGTAAPGVDELFTLQPRDDGLIQPQAKKSVNSGGALDKKVV